MSSRPQYLFKRHGSDNWYVRLQPPGQKIVERSLGTPDLKLAEIAAMPLIREHKAFMYQRRPTVTPFWHRAYEPGLRMIDGEQVIATDRELQYLDASGNVIRREPNGGPAELLSPAPLSGVPSFKAYDDAKRPTPAVKNSDDGLLETYIKHNGVTGYREREARTMWHIFKTVVNKPLRSCARDDGRAIVEYLEDQAGGEIKSSTLRRKMVPLVATVGLAIKEGKLTFNPFAGVVPDRDDSERRVPFDDDDMVLIRENLHRLDDKDRLLVCLLATSGLRRGEAFEIDQEQTEGGCRFVIVGTKTEQSRRRVPFPAELLPYLPAKIAGPLFTGRKDSTTKRLIAFLRKIGITDPNKVPHSFRHRAQDRLRAAGVPEDMRWALLGHEKRTVASGYGKGFPVPMLKEAIDKIGM
jgi:integrase